MDTRLQTNLHMMNTIGDKTSVRIVENWNRLSQYMVEATTVPLDQLIYYDLCMEAS